MSKNNCIGSLSDGSCAPMAFCGLRPGLVQSQLLDKSQMQLSECESVARTNSHEGP